jgi:hypothetical protein
MSKQRYSQWKRYFLFSLKDHCYFGGEFETQKQAEEYAISIGLLPDECEIREAVK